ncbi:hypothetical protein SAMN04487936_101387 [Halobacillus dabanensis]|uniref:Uncharacterized protein n=1 Tax=Halobacillus dabanensis TaxID=240302 RepID=A0A1I3PN09_HALDA|nr:hypothetical protein SAMN04487936_101387 [Halobacillus dabanensis]
MVLRMDGFGGTRYYPENSELTIVCTYKSIGHRYVIVQYLDLPFSYRKVNRDGLCFLEPKLYDFLCSELERIDSGFYDDDELALKIIQKMCQQKHKPEH